MRLALSRRAVLFVPALLLVIAFTTLSRAADSKAPPRLVAKAPPPAAQSAPQTPDTHSTAKREQPVRRVAQADILVPAGATSGQLLDSAQDYDWYNDSAHQQQLLQAAAAAQPDSTAAGLALVLLASTYATTDPAQSQALYAQASSYADPEVQAFMALVQASSAAIREQRWQDATALLSAAARDWKGPFTGGWAIMNLGSLYRDFLSDPESATKVYSEAAAYPGATAEDAIVSLAETVAWAGNDRGAELLLAQQATDTVTDDRFRRRALLALGNALQDTGENGQAIAVMSSVIERWPDHPIAMLARITRSQSAYILGDLTMAADDAEAYLSYFDRKQMNVNYAHLAMGNRAFRDGDYVRAQAEFTTLLNSPGNDEFLGPAHNGLAQSLSAQGDLRGALSELLQAADSPVSPSLKATYLYGAAIAAQQAGDTASLALIARRMETECPGSHLTTQLLGRELLTMAEN